MEITFLGTNGWFDTHTGATSCVFLDTKDCYIILDCGSGFYKVPSLLKEENPFPMNLLMASVSTQIR